MGVVQSRNDERIGGAIAAAIANGLLGYALIVGLAVKLPDAMNESLKLFALAPPPRPPSEKPIRHPVPSRKAEGAASPPNLKARATEIVVPPVIVPLRIPPPVVAALKPGVGAAPFSGSAEIRGPGTGSGGVGNGTGSGGSGDGDGAGGEETPPRWLRGRLKDSDYPSSVADAGISGTVSVRYTVGVMGRVTDCTVTKSSGSPELDTLTCRLIQQRFRFAPSRDMDGRPVAAGIIEDHTWIIEEPPPPPHQRR